MSGISTGTAAMVGGVVFLIILALNMPPDQPPAAEPQPAATPGSGIRYAPFVFIDTDTGCEYLSTHTSTGMVPRVSADGMTQKGCTGIER